VLAALQEHLSKQRLDNQTPSFPLDAVLPWFEERTGASIKFLTNRVQHGPHQLESDLANETKIEVWIHERRLHMRGARSEQLAPLLRPHEAVITEDAIAEFREALRTRNPFSDELFGQLIARARAVGVDLSPWLQNHLKLISAEPADTSIPAWSERGESNARDILSELSRRAWHFPVLHDPCRRRNASLALFRELVGKAESMMAGMRRR
jgi:hypothetical protein